MPMRITSTRRCRGVAPLEFVISFPLLVLLMATFFLLISAAVTRMQTANQSRHLAFQGRYASESSPYRTIDTIDVRSSTLIKRIHGVGSRSSSTEAIMWSRTSKTANPILRIFEGVLPKAVVQNFVLFDPWDFRVLPFERHPRLQVSKRARSFGLTDADLDAFAILASVGSEGKHNGSTDQESKHVQRSRQEVREALKAAEGELAQLRSTLQSLLTKIPSPRDQIRQIEARIAEKVQQIADLNDALANLSKFGNR